MIIILFITLVIVFYLVRHFENRRQERNLKRHERSRASFTNLLNSLKDKNAAADQPEKKEHEP